MAFCVHFLLLMSLLKLLEYSSYEKIQRNELGWVFFPEISFCEFRSASCTSASEDILPCGQMLHSMFSFKLGLWCILVEFCVKNGLLPVECSILVYFPQHWQLSHHTFLSVISATRISASWNRRNLSIIVWSKTRTLRLNMINKEICKQTNQCFFNE